MSANTIVDSQSCSAARRRIIRQWVVGVGTYKLLDGAFDYAIYPAAIYTLGPVRGGCVMTTLAVIICFAYLRLYDRLKRDWLGIEFVKALRFYTGSSRARRAFAWLLRASDTFAFVALSLRFDPFITTAYMRRGSFGGLARRDWCVFWGSVLVSNVTWTFACFGGIAGIRRLLAATG